jgi:hypothetical protein
MTTDDVIIDFAVVEQGDSFSVLALTPRALEYAREHPEVRDWSGDFAGMLDLACDLSLAGYELVWDLDEKTGETR